MCGIHVEGSRICFDCMFDLIEKQDAEEALAHSPDRSFSVISNRVVHTFWRSGHNCNHCWPMDCRCY